MKILLCLLFGAHNLAVDIEKLKASCRTCGQLFEITSGYFGQTFIKIEEKLNCDCYVDDRFGFKPIEQCREHNNK